MAVLFASDNPENMSLKGGSPLPIKRMDQITWAVFDEDEQILTIEKKLPEVFPEFEVRECLPHSKRGAVLVEFLGPQAFSSACQWAQSYRSEPRLKANRFPARKAGIRQPLRTKHDHDQRPRAKAR